MLLSRLFTIYSTANYSTYLTYLLLLELVARLCLSASDITPERSGPVWGLAIM
ncbi:hypothetical protein Mapa_003472 [Marchantia paleacea]|nr:hypothetical protein Mapa_003472 [Marchantia paleacea]